MVTRLKEISTKGLAASDTPAAALLAQEASGVHRALRAPAAARGPRRSMAHLWSMAHLCRDTEVPRARLLAALSAAARLLPRNPQRDPPTAAARGAPLPTCPKRALRASSPVVDMVVYASRQALC